VPVAAAESRVGLWGEHVFGYDVRTPRGPGVVIFSGPPSTFGVFGRRVVSRLRSLVSELREEAAAFEVDRWAGADCAVLAEELAATAKACAAASARAAARALECNARRDGVEWLARTVGSTPAEARATLATIAAAVECPETSEALAAGAVSFAQAREIVRAEQTVPGSETALLEVAATRGIAGLRAEARRVVLGSIDREELHAEQWRVRSVQHWVDDLGMVAGRFRLPPEVGVPFVHQLDAETDRVLRAAKREGSTEARDAHAADAFVAMMSGGGQGKSTRADVVFVCDLNAAVRGHTHGDEVCHVIGAGPVPVSVVRDAAVRGFVKVAVRDGTKLDTIVHYGRKIPAELRTALELGDPERLDGAVCVEDGCDRRHNLEWDHVDPVANGGKSSYENIEPRCQPDHWAKTERDRKTGLLDGKRGLPDDP
jgi:HNH endonuclease